MELQRTILWVIFAASAILLWDRWQVAHGGTSMVFPQARSVVQAPAAGNAPAGAAAAASSTAGIPGAATPAPSATVPAGPTGASGIPLSGEAAVAPASEIVRVDTDVLRLEFDALGGVVSRAQLLQEKTATPWTALGIAGFVTRNPETPQQDIVLFERTATQEYAAQSGLSGGPELASFPNHLHTRFDVLPGPRSLGADAQELQVRFEARSGGLLLRKTFVLHRGRYDIEVRHEVENVGAEPLSPTLYLQLVHDDRKVGDESRFASTYTGPAIYNDDLKYRKISFEDIGKNSVPDLKPGPEGWVAMIQHYFVTAWVPEAGAQRDFYTSKISEHQFAVGTKLPLGAIAPGATVARKAVLWVGPQDQRALEGVAKGLELVADYGKLDVIAKPLFWLLGFLHSLVGNWGWAIVLLTILIKAAFYPLAAAGFKSMAKMKELAPRLELLKKQYGDDKQRLQQAMMELYRKEKINPFGSCLPILVQIPVFIALYWVLLGSVEMRNAPWVLWIHDLASPDPWFILPLLMMGTSWIQFKLNPTPADPVQAKMMATMPFIFGVMFFFFPSGLVLYYLLNNMLSIAQQWRINRVIAAGKAA